MERHLSTNLYLGKLDQKLVVVVRGCLFTHGTFIEIRKFHCKDTMSSLIIAKQSSTYWQIRLLLTYRFAHLQPRREPEKEKLCCMLELYSKYDNIKYLRSILRCD